MKTKVKASGAEALFGAAFTYALTGILVRGVDSMWSDSAQVLARFLLVLLFLVGFQLVRKNKHLIPKDKFRVTVYLGIFFALMVLLFTSALGKTTVANVLFVFYATNMITSFLLGTFLLKENVTVIKIIAIIFTLAGLAVYSGAIAGGNKGIILAMLTGIAGGLVNYISKLLRGVDRNRVLFVQYSIGTAVAGVVTLLSGDAAIRTVSLHASLLTILFALVIILGSYLTLYGFQNFDVNIGTVIMSTELVFAAVMAYFIFNEIPETHELIGGILIFSGSVIGSGIFEKTKLAKLRS